jgi:hypothetical protein
LGFFKERVSQTICPGWLRAMILLSKITGMTLAPGLYKVPLICGFHM